MSRIPVVSAALLLAACGGGGGDDEPLCGNGELDDFEICDDGNDVDDDGCTNACVFPCGDGILQPSEGCDIAITTGEGVCVTSVDECDDGDDCTDDTFEGEQCGARCINAPVDFHRDGDMCCPEIEDAISYFDFDCPAGCGNGYVEMGESCDTTISAMLGACPDLAFCDDGSACTVDTVTGAECAQGCANTEITAVAASDGCCPAGATSTTDNDCSPVASCGNSIVNGGMGETCDTAIAAGNAGACPTECTSDDPCKIPMLLSEGTCEARCHDVDVKFPMNDDGCCPVFYGGNNRNDNDCTSSCGTPAEECTTPGVGDCDPDCRIVRTTFRVISIAVKDPHIYFDNGTGGCADLTSIVNTSVVPDNLEQDTNGDGCAEIAWLNMFKPLDRTAATNPYELVYGCCAPSPDPAATTCEADPLTERLVVTANNMAGGECLGVVAGTLTEAYATPPETPMGPCFVTDEFDAVIKMGDLSVPLTDGNIAATYDADPATGLISGLIRGFVTEADAQATIIPIDVVLVGGKSLAEVLAGGIAPGSCTIGSDPIGDDRDTGPGGASGWWFYVNFTATTIPFEDKPNASE
jgi:cysteine-rich repeat protein